MYLYSLFIKPYLPNTPHSPTFMGPLHCFVLCLIGDCGKIVIFAIFTKFANFYGLPLLLCALPCWRLWQNCHIHRICLIRRRSLFFASFVGACISGHVSWMKRMLRSKPSFSAKSVSSSQKTSSDFAKPPKSEVMNHLKLVKRPE